MINREATVKARYKLTHCNICIFLRTGAARSFILVGESVGDYKGTHGQHR